MKISFVFLLLFSFLTASAQTDTRIFYSQLMVVFSDIEKNFEYLKGDLRSSDDGVFVYETIRSLEGTTDNVVITDSVVYEYRAQINDSTSEEGSELIVAAWKKKLNDALSGMFSAPAEFRSDIDPATTGYQYSSEKIAVLLLRHKEKSGWYWIQLVIKPK